MRKFLFLLFLVFSFFLLKPTNALTIINETFVETPFSFNQRVICRDDAENIHVVWLYNLTTVRYARSSDGGISFNNFIDFNYPPNFEKGTPHISCDGKKIIVTFSTNRSSLVIYNSSDRGNSWSYQELRVGSVRSKSSVVAEIKGSNIYVAYENYTGAFPLLASHIRLFNSTDEGNTWNEDIIAFEGTPGFVPTVSYYTPSLAITDGIIHMAAIKSISYFLSWVMKLVYKNSATWTEKEILGAGGSESTAGGISDYSLVSYSNSIYLSCSWFYRSTSYISFASSQDYGNSWSVYNINNPALGIVSFSSIALDTENLPIVFWRENEDIVFRKYDGVDWVPEDRFKLTEDPEIRDRYPSAKAISNNLIEVVWKRENKIVYDSFVKPFQVIPLRPGENTFEIASPLVLRTLKLVGDRKYLNIFWQAEYLEGWKKEIGIKCYLNCPYDDIRECKNYQNCSSTTLSSYQGICTISEPRYDFTNLNSLICEVNDPTLSSNGETSQIWKFWPLYFSSSPLKDISATVGEEIVLSINVKNLGLLTDNYTINITPLNNHHLISIRENLMNISEVKTNDTKSVTVRITPLFSTNFNLGIWLYSQSPEWFSCDNCPNGFVCEKVSNKCAKYFEIKIESGYPSLEELNLKEIIFLILIVLVLIYRGL